MTDADLEVLYNERERAWDLMGGIHGTLSNLSPEDRASAERCSQRFRAADVAIADELRQRNVPARLKDVELRLTADRLNWLAFEPGTLTVKGYPESSSRRAIALSFLYKYPCEEKQGRVGKECGRCGCEK